MTKPGMDLAVSLAWQLDALLGEGPVWLPREQALRFVDIKRGRLHRFDPATSTGETREVGGMPSFVVPAAAGGLLVGSGDGVFRFDGTHLGERIATLPQPASNRTNDATVDPRGRLWLGTMDNLEQAETGEVWCLAQGQPHRAGPRAVVTNGPAVSPAGDVLYLVNSGERTIWRFPLGDAPTLGKGELFLRLTPTEGHPDGVIVDSEGCLWVALWDGWGLRRYAPNGTLLLHVPLPCARVTKLALGGPDLRTAFVTTARIGLTEAELTRQPLAGSLFTFTAPAPGVPLPEVVLA